MPIPSDGAALMNLHWAAYGVLAEQFKTATKPTKFKAVIGYERIIEASVTVKPGAAGAREVTVAVGPLEVHATVDKSGAVTHAEVPSQGIEVKPGTSASAPPVRRKAPGRHRRAAHRHRQPRRPHRRRPVAAAGRVADGEGAGGDRHRRLGPRRPRRQRRRRLALRQLSPARRGARQARRRRPSASTSAASASRRSAPRSRSSASTTS